MKFSFMIDLGKLCGSGYMKRKIINSKDMFEDKDSGYHISPLDSVLKTSKSDFYFSVKRDIICSCLTLNVLKFK